MAQQEIDFYPLQNDYSMGVMPAPMAQPMNLLAKQELCTPHNTPQTLPLIQPMDLSNYNGMYSTPLVSHNLLPVSHDRYRQSPSFTNSPDLLAHSLSTQSAFSTPEWHSGHRMTKSYSGSMAGVNPMSMFFTQPGPGLASLDNSPLMGKELSSWRTYPYSQPHEHWESAPASEEEDKEKTKDRARRHVCPVCDKRFNRPSSLSTHMAVHTGAKPFQCHWPECGRCFSVSSNLRRHERTHENRRVKERSDTGEPLDLLTKPLAFRPANSHSHSQSLGSHPYAYPAIPYNSSNHAAPAFPSYTYGTAPLLDLGIATATTASTTVAQTPLSTSLVSGGGFGSIGVGNGLEQYSITRPSTGGSRESSDSGLVTTPKSALEGFDLINDIKEAEAMLR